MKKRESGAIIIEGCLFLPLFMFTIIIILSIVNICFAQAKIGVALNTSAKEISQYSYLYGLTGLNEKQASLYSDGEAARGGIDDILGGVGTLFNSASKIGGGVSDIAEDPSNYQNVYQNMQEAYASGKQGYSQISNTVKSVSENPSDYIMSAAKMIGNEALEYGKSKLIAEPLARVFCKKHLVGSSKDNVESFLKYLRVVPKDGSYYGGIDFSDSVVFLNGTNEIKLVAHYDIKVLELLGFEFKFSFTQCGATKAWFAPKLEVNESGKDGSESGGDEENEKENENENEKENENEVSIEDYATAATHNGSSSQVLLGKYTPVDAEGNYIEMARMYDAAYYSMDNDTWQSLKAEKGEDYLWKINEAFLESQNGKEFILTENPDNATGTYKKEIQWLKNHGYKVDSNECYNEARGVWVVKK